MFLACVYAGSFVCWIQQILPVLWPMLAIVVHSLSIAAYNPAFDSGPFGAEHLQEFIPNKSTRVFIFAVANQWSWLHNHASVAKERKIGKHHISNIFKHTVYVNVCNILNHVVSFREALFSVGNIPCEPWPEAWLNWRWVKVGEHCSIEKFKKPHWPHCSRWCTFWMHLQFVCCLLYTIPITWQSLLAKLLYLSLIIILHSYFEFNSDETTRGVISICTVWTPALSVYNVSNRQDLWSMTRSLGPWISWVLGSAPHGSSERENAQHKGCGRFWLGKQISKHLQQTPSTSTNN